MDCPVILSMDTLDMRTPALPPRKAYVTLQSFLMWKTLVTITTIVPNIITFFMNNLNMVLQFILPRKLFSHLSQLYCNPLWLLIWSFKCDAWLYDFSHSWHWYLTAFSCALCHICHTNLRFWYVSSFLATYKSIFTLVTSMFL